jgi:hypothetical protein
MDKRTIEKKKKELRDLYGQERELLDVVEGDVATDEEKEKLYQSLDILRRKIEAQKDEIDQMTEDNKELNRRKRKLTIEEEKQILDRVFNEYDVSFNPLLGKFVYCKDYSNGQSNKHCNPQFQMFESSKINNMLRQWTKHTFEMDYPEIIRYFQECNQSHEMNVFTFHNENWNKDDVYNRARILKDKYWIKPDDNLDNYMRDAFEDLFYCVCGGKQENIDHLRTWIAYKYLYPERNSSIPNIDLGGHPGGNGKNTLVILLKTIFLRSTVKATTKDELLKFNGPWEDAIVLHYDEPEENELPGAKLKNATGTDEQRIEKKGFDAYQADRNYNFIFTSNNPKGCIKLEGGGKGASDRRYSVITTDIVMRQYVKDKYNMTDEEAGEYINGLLDVMRDREQASMWMYDTIKTYNVDTMTELHALHGIDYNKRFEDQKTNLDLVFDEITKVVETTKVIPLETVSQVASAILYDGMNKKFDNRKIKQNYIKYLEKNGYKGRYDFKERHHLKILWDGEVADPNSDILQVTCLLLDEGDNKFEFSEVSSRRYEKGTALTKDYIKVNIQ